MDFLDDFVHKHNLFLKEPVSLATLTQAQYSDLLESLDFKCSPESLYADGERPPEQVARWSEYYRKVYASLTRLGKVKGFVQPELHAVQYL